MSKKLTDADLIEIDLREIDTYVVSGYPERQNNIKERLGFLKLNFIPSPKSEPRYFAVASGLLRILTNNKIKTPFLLLEDDVDITEDYNDTITLPRNCDGCFLGTATFGVTPIYPNKKGFNTTIAVEFNENINKICNMLTHHAVIFISEKYRSHTVETTHKAIINDTFTDHDMARTMNKFNIYAPKKQYFFQSTIFSNSPYQQMMAKETSTILPTIKIGHIIEYNALDGKTHRAVLTKQNGLLLWKEV